MELMIPLSSQDPRPLYEQIYQYIKGEIRNGGLKPMKKLPSSRELAKSLRVSRSTTQSAYEQLVAEGYLEASSRRGYFVAGLGWDPAPGRSGKTGGTGNVSRPEGWGGAGSPGEKMESGLFTQGN